MEPVTITEIRETFPEDVRQLHARIVQIISYRKGIIPASARHIIQNVVADGSNWPPGWFAEETEEESTFWVQDEVQTDKGQNMNESNVSFAARKQQRAQQQFTSLRRIQRDAEECLRRGCSEATWNVKVYAPLLELAVRDRRAVFNEPVTTAYIASQWLPCVKGGGPVAIAATTSTAGGTEAGVGESETTAHPQGTSSAAVAGKMIDFALVLNLDPPEGFEPLAGPMQQLLDTQPLPLGYINQSLYAPLKYSPIGVSVSVEAEPDSTAARGRLRLGVWTAAWHRRISELIPPGSKITTLPLVLVEESNWELYFACDEGREIQMVGPMQIGSTDDMLSSYTLLAVLRELVAWVDTQFREWVFTTLLAVD
ncbi:hypothetical protein MAPG_10628 [Magnaporthiopsis poae ATCC 64411]|uniref:PD-(D/E)XK nuclease-like domain-containing protein n=1 Tax=Magnaporthiopsis poae (strain ATCC 64411 / 73-15) TaxID=644358 RepID=A0A0C4ED35_MAGP6|nr:hypothetical protein MAPG_10628 [Magnaporthiopsis poae ATCC 64411]